jgi:hypothetical protein
MVANGSVPGSYRAERNQSDMTDQGSALTTTLQNLVQSVGALAQATQFVEVMGYTFVGDVDYQILPTNRTINSSAVSTANHTWTFPPLSSVKPGQRFTLIMAPGAFTIKLVGSGTDNMWSTESGSTPALYTDGGTVIWDFIADVGAGLWLNWNRSPLAYTAPGGRLTISPTVPVPSTNVTNATAVNYTPYTSTWAPILQGADMQMVNLGGGDLTQALSDTTKSPAAAVALTNYDMFLWNDAGTFRCTRGPAWTNASTRSMALQKFASGSALWVNSANITNGPAALRGTYVGTIWTDGSTFLQHIFGGAASGGSAPEFLVWNMFNRVDLIGVSIDNGATYTYASSTFRQARNAGGNNAFFVCGLVEDSFTSTYEADMSIPSGGTNRGDNAIALNGTILKRSTITNLSTTAALPASNHVTVASQPTLGQNSLTAEEAAGTGTITFDNLSENRFHLMWRG